MNRRQFLYLAAAAAANANASVSYPQTQRTLLLVDEHHILYRSGTRRHIVPLKRYADNPLLTGGVYRWEDAIGWNSTYLDPETGLYKIWYQAYSGKRSRKPQERCVVCYAESDDGLHWKRPQLNFFSYNGYSPTNIVLVGNGGHSSNYGVSVVVTPDDPDPGRRYKMAYFDWWRKREQEYPGLSVAFSPDGLHWKKYPTGPLLRASYGTPGQALPYEGETDRPWSIPLSISDALFAMYDPKRHVYVIYSKMWIDSPDGTMYWKHVMARTESKDFIHWSNPEIVLTPDDRDPPWLEFHAAPVFFYNDCYFALLQILHRSVGHGVINIELAISRDGIHWKRPFRKHLFFQRSKGRQFDSGSIFLDPTPIFLKDEFRFYYGGYSDGATSTSETKLLSGIGLATMQRDRFAGIEPLDTVGQVTMKVLNLRGVAKCLVNADASNGSVRLEILGADERRIHGFTSDDALPIRGNDLSHVARWKARTLTDLPGGDYIIRIHLEKATVFAITLVS